MSRINIVWFRNDLRLHDNISLHAAAEDGRYIIPVYIIDPQLFSATPYGFPRVGKHRLRFLLEGLRDLRNSFRERGCDLIIRTGRPEEIIPDLALEYNAGSVYFSQEYAEEELVQEWK